MSKESFKILKEINSLTINIEEFQLKIDAQLGRVQSVNSNRDNRQAQKTNDENLLKETSSKLNLAENEISHLQLKLTKDKENLSTISSEQVLKNMEKQIADLGEKISELEEIGLNEIENIEILEQKIADADEFLKGSLESLNEIKGEVETLNADHQSNIDKLLKRIDLLTQELPKDFSERYFRTLKSKIKGSIFARITNEACEYCRFGLSKMEVQKVEDQLNLKNCASCGRIFIPQAAFY
jgi:predicted  nucleic acid-binding Zn-ribbon protein